MARGWKDDLADLEGAKGLSAVEMATRRVSVGLCFLRDEVYPLLERTATALSETGRRPEVQPVAQDQIGPQGESAAMLTIRSSSGTVTFRVLLTSDATMVVDFQKPYSDSERSEFEFGFYSADRVRRTLGRFLAENELPRARDI